MSTRKQIEDIIQLLDKKHKVIHHGGHTGTIDGKTFPISQIREATQKRFVQRVIRRHKDATNANGTELSSGLAALSQATGQNQDGSERADQGSGDQP